MSEKFSFPTNVNGVSDDETKKFSFPTNVNGVSDDDTKKCQYSTDSKCIEQAEKNSDFKKTVNTDTTSYQPDSRVGINRNGSGNWTTSPLEADTPIERNAGSGNNR